ncbi:hypothetical protein Nepgr_012651 [Nepenthes gracilis]|uniref:Uncharacterized protein n=1 Tax=Nepenthes gracilis TaxID=150966 RepID=A0AAD3SHA5_NEPGR|nr:hypothetical protein Nepgr_012651 [Nepenthes gracilis]
MFGGDKRAVIPHPSVAAEGAKIWESALVEYFLVEGLGHHGVCEEVEINSELPDLIELVVINDPFSGDKLSIMFKVEYMRIPYMLNVATLPTENLKEDSLESSSSKKGVLANNFNCLACRDRVEAVSCRNPHWKGAPFVCRSL